jgi:hypothetical protein
MPVGVRVQTCRRVDHKQGGPLGIAGFGDVVPGLSDDEGLFFPFFPLSLPSTLPPSPLLEFTPFFFLTSS